MRKQPGMIAVTCVVLAGGAVACGGHSSPSTTTTETTTATATEPAGTAASTARPSTPLAQLPAAIRPLLPRNGIYAAGGGLMSNAWRVVVDIDANTIASGTMDAPNTSSTGPLDHESHRDLTPRNKNHLMQMAYAAWAEPPPSRPTAPMADYDEVLIVTEGDQVFFLEGYGPIRQPLAAKAIVEVRAAAGL